MRQFLIPLLALGAVGAAYLLAGSSPEDLAHETRSGSEGRLGTPHEATLGGVHKEPSAELATANPYAGVTDWKVLGRGLWLNGERDAAVARAVELLHGKPDEIRALVRRLHPCAGESQHSGRSILRGVAQTLVKLGDSALDLLLGELDDENAVYRTRVVALIGSFGGKAERTLPALFERFHAIQEDPPAGETASYLNALRFIGPAAKEVVPDLERWIGEGATLDVEIAAIRALGQIAGPTDAVFESYREVLQAEEWTAQRSTVLEQLGDFGAKAASMIPYLLELVDEGKLSEDRAMATLGRIGVAHEDVLARAERGLRAVPAECELLGLHAYALARLGDEGMRRLMAFVEERGLWARARLPTTLRDAGFDHDRIFDLAAPALGSTDIGLRSTAWMNVTILDRLQPSTAEPAILRDLKHEDKRVREAVVCAVGHWSGLTHAVARALLAIVEDAEEEMQLRLDVARLLVRRQPQPPERLYNALLAIHRRHPKVKPVYLLHPWLQIRTAVVLRLWVENLPRPELRHIYWDFIRQLPLRVRRQHRDAIRTLGLDPETGRPLVAAGR